MAVVRLLAAFAPTPVLGPVESGLLGPIVDPGRPLGAVDIGRPG